MVAGHAYSGEERFQGAVDVAYDSVTPEQLLLTTKLARRRTFDY